MLTLVRSVRVRLQWERSAAEKSQPRRSRPARFERDRRLPTNDLPASGTAVRSQSLISSPSQTWGRRAPASPQAVKRVSANAAPVKSAAGKAACSMLQPPKIARGKPASVKVRPRSLIRRSRASLKSGPLHWQSANMAVESVDPVHDGPSPVQLIQAVARSWLASSRISVRSHFARLVLCQSHCVSRQRSSRQLCSIPRSIVTPVPSAAVNRQTVKTASAKVALERLQSLKFTCSNTAWRKEQPARLRPERSAPRMTTPSNAAPGARLAKSSASDKTR